MRILIDECLPRKLARSLTGHEAQTVHEAGWASVKNGQLLKLAEEKFDIFLTNDGGLEYQQNLASFRIAIVALRLRSNKLKDILPFLPKILAAIDSAKRGQVICVEP